MKAIDSREYWRNLIVVYTLKDTLLFPDTSAWTGPDTCFSLFSPLSLHTVLMYRGEALEDFTGPDCRFVSFKKGDPVYVYYKLAGRPPEVWAGSVSTNLTRFSFLLSIGLFLTVDGNNCFRGVFDGVTCPLCQTGETGVCVSRAGIRPGPR